MTLYKAIVAALDGRTTPLAGRAIADAAGIGYKAAIDALGRMHDAGTVIRFGRKRSSTWALRGTPAARQPDLLGAVEEAWRARTGAAAPHPTGGEGEAPPGLAYSYRSLPQKFFGAQDRKFFFDTLN